MKICMSFQTVLCKLSRIFKKVKYNKFIIYCFYLIFILIFQLFQMLFLSFICSYYNLECLNPSSFFNYLQKKVFFLIKDQKKNNQDQSIILNFCFMILHSRCSIYSEFYNFMIFFKVILRIKMYLFKVELSFQSMKNYFKLYLYQSNFDLIQNLKEYSIKHLYSYLIRSLQLIKKTLLIKKKFKFNIK